MTTDDPTVPATRRAMARAARDAFPPMGVVAVRDRQTGRTQVLAGRNAPGILHRIGFELRQGCHRDAGWQAAWRDGGPDRVSLEVLELVRERDDPAFDYDAELATLRTLYRDELATDGVVR